MNTVYLALGANIGDRAKNIETAVSLLSRKVAIKKRAALYESKAVGFENQDNFLNTALEGETELSPAELLAFAKDIENQVGRVGRFHWGPREIDIDILFYGDLVLCDDTLEVPHKEIANRDFVLTPLAEIAPNLVHPILGKSISELEKMFSPTQRSVLAKVSV